MNRPRIYVASSWRNPKQGEVVEALRNAQFDVYDFKNPDGKSGFAWSDIDPDWLKWTPAQFIDALGHPTAINGFRSDMGALAESDACVLLLPCGRSAHLELGYAVGAGKFTCILTCPGQEPELMYRMVNVLTDDIRQVIDRLQTHFGIRTS
jgi:hypothetical protein